MKTSKMDRLSRHAIQAQEAGMSYGKFMATFHPELPKYDDEDLEEIEEKAQEHFPNGRTPVIGICKKTGEQRYYKSMSDTKADGFNSSSVGNTCRGIYKAHMGWNWRKATIEEIREHEGSRTADRKE